MFLETLCPLEFFLISPQTLFWTFCPSVIGALEIKVRKQVSDFLSNENYSRFPVTFQSFAELFIRVCPKPQSTFHMWLLYWKCVLISEVGRHLCKLKENKQWISGSCKFKKCWEREDTISKSSYFAEARLQTYKSSSNLRDRPLRRQFSRSKGSDKTERRPPKFNVLSNKKTFY